MKLSKIVTILLVLNAVVLHYKNSTAKKSITKYRILIQNKRHTILQHKTLLAKLTHPNNITKIVHKKTNYKQAYVHQFIKNNI